MLNPTAAKPAGAVIFLARFDCGISGKNGIPVKNVKS
jgi:hypothetical protein